MAICNIHSDVVNALISTSLHSSYTWSLLPSTVSSNLHIILILLFLEFEYSVLEHFCVEGNN